MRPVLAGVPLLVACAAYGQCQPHWLPGSGRLDMDYTVYGSTLWDPDGAGPLGERLVLAGDFFTAGRSTSRCVAAWDGQEYHPLGAGIVDLGSGGAFAVCNYRGDLYLGLYSFTAPLISCLYRWNGTNWVGVAGGLWGVVDALTVHQDRLIAAGRFNISQSLPFHAVVQWDGENLSPVGTGLGGFSGHAYALLSTPEGLYAGGRYLSTTTELSSLARWDGSTWTHLGLTNPAVVSALALHEGQIYAGTGYHTPLPYLGRFNGSSWEGVTGIEITSNTVIYSLRSTPQGLLVGGNFSVNGGADQQIALWNGQSWSGVGAGFNFNQGSVFTIAEYQNHVYAAGNVRTTGSQPLSRVARWTGSEWTPLHAGTESQARAFLTHNGDLYVGGSFRQLEGVNVPGIARRTQGSWEPLALGPAGNAGGNSIVALASHGSTIYAGGAFFPDPPQTSFRVAAWNGSAWTRVGDGLPSYNLTTITVHQGELWAAVSGSAVRVFRWDGTAWMPAQNSTGFNYEVRALLSTGDALYAGGDFGQVDGETIRGVARWDGAAWQPVGAGVPFLRVNTLASHDGQLFAGGYEGPGSQFNVARFDGAAWTLTQAPVEIRHFAVHQGSLYCSGNNYDSPGAAYRWTGSAWEPFPARAHGPLHSHFENGQPVLYVGGSFVDGGRVESFGLTRYACPCYANCDNSTTPPLLNVADLACFLQQFAAADPYANCDGSTTPPVLNIADFACFLQQFAAGCQ